MSPIGKNKEKISKMFNDIASDYDATGHFLSFGIDRLWRRRIKKVITKNQSSPIQILDLASGTGDLAFELSSISESTIIGIDISEKMLEMAKIKQAKNRIQNIQFIHGDALNVPFPDNTFDVVTIAFGIRNFENVENGIKEIYRLLKPNGRYYILELTRPNAFIQPFYLIYLNWILPMIGSIFTHKKNAYIYLKETIKDFEQDDDLSNLFKSNSFTDTHFSHWSFGIATLYTGVKTIKTPKNFEKTTIDNKICEVTFHAN